MDRAAEWPTSWRGNGQGHAALAAGRLVRFGVLFATCFVLLILPQLIWIAVRPRVPSPFARLFLRAVAIAAGLRVEVIGERRRPSGLIVANHVSWTDILVMGGAARTAFVARRDVRGWPFLGFLSRLNGTIFVERAARFGVLDQSVALAEGLGRGSVALFPEGTTGDGGDVLPFRPALLEAAADRAIQPVAIAYAPRKGSLADFAWDGDKTFLPHLVQVVASGGARCRLTVLPPIPAGCGDRKAKALQARAAIRAALHPTGF